MKFPTLIFWLFLYFPSGAIALELEASMSLDTDLKETIELSYFDQSANVFAKSRFYTTVSGLYTVALACQFEVLGFGNATTSGEFVFWEKGSKSLSALDEQGVSGVDRQRLFNPERLSSPETFALAFDPYIFDSLLVLDPDYVLVGVGLVPLRTDEVFLGLWYLNQERLDHQSSFYESWIMNFDRLRPSKIEGLAASVSFDKLGLRAGGMLEFYGLYSSRAFYVTFAKSFGSGAHYFGLDVSLACNDQGFIGMTGTWIDELLNLRAGFTKGVFEWLRVALDFGYQDSYIDGFSSQKFLRYELFLGDEGLGLRVIDQIDLGTLSDRFEATVEWQFEVLAVSAEIVFGEAYSIRPRLKLDLDQVELRLQGTIKNKSVGASLTLDLFDALSLKASFDKDLVKEVATWYGSIELELKS